MNQAGRDRAKPLISMTYLGRSAMDKGSFNTYKFAILHSKIRTCHLKLRRLTTAMSDFLAIGLVKANTQQKR